jgi:hypothetical protein
VVAGASRPPPRFATSVKPEPTRSPSARRSSTDRSRPNKGNIVSQLRDVIEAADS